MLITLTSCGKSNKPSTQPTTDEPSTTITTPSDHNPRLVITSIVDYINKNRIVRNQHFQPMISDNSIMIFTHGEPVLRILIKQIFIFMLTN